jgi:hypothetical protein
MAHFTPVAEKREQQTDGKLLRLARSTLSNEHQENKAELSFLTRT